MTARNTRPLIDVTRAPGHCGVLGVARSCRRLLRLLLVLSMMFYAGPPPAAAQDSGARPDGSFPTLVTLGFYGVTAPRFEGSRRHDVLPWPIISWRQTNEREWLELPKDGFDYALIETDKFRAGLVGNWRWQRETDTIVPRGFAQVGHAKIGLSLEAGLFAEYWATTWWRNRVEAREAVYGARGLIANLSSDFVWRPNAAWTLAAGPRLSLIDQTFATSYYGVDAAQAAVSGLPTTKAHGGIRSYGAGAFAQYKFSPSWQSRAFIEHERLTGEAGESPVIASRGARDQVTVGLGLVYTFKAPW